MTRFISLIRFTEQGARAIQQSASRAKAFREAAAKAEVKVEAQYWTVGAFDGLIITSAVDERQALHQLARLAEAGNVRTETLRALTAEEFSAIVGK